MNGLTLNPSAPRSEQVVLMRGPNGAFHGKAKASRGHFYSLDYLRVHGTSDIKRALLQLKEGLE